MPTTNISIPFSGGTLQNAVNTPGMITMDLDATNQIHFFAQSNPSYFYAMISSPDGSGGRTYGPAYLLRKGTADQGLMNINKTRVVRNTTTNGLTVLYDVIGAIPDGFTGGRPFFGQGITYNVSDKSITVSAPYTWSTNISTSSFRQARILDCVGHSDSYFSFRVVAINTNTSSLVGGQYPVTMYTYLYRAASNSVSQSTSSSQQLAAGVATNTSLASLPSELALSRFTHGAQNTMSVTSTPAAFYNSASEHWMRTNSSTSIALNTSHTSMGVFNNTDWPFMTALQNARYGTSDWAAIDQLYVNAAGTAIMFYDTAIANWQRAVFGKFNNVSVAPFKQNVTGYRFLHAISPNFFVMGILEIPLTGTFTEIMDKDFLPTPTALYLRYFRKINADVWEVDAASTGADGIKITLPTTDATNPDAYKALPFGVNAFTFDVNRNLVINYQNGNKPLAIKLV